MKDACLISGDEIGKEREHVVSLLKIGCQVENHAVRKMSSEVFRNEL